MAGSLCLGCGVETKSGARRVIEPSELSPVASLVKKIIDTRLSEAPVAGISSESIFCGSEKYLCRPCFGKYQRVVDTYTDLVLGVDNLYPTLSGKEDVTCHVGMKRRQADVQGPSAKKNPIVRSLVQSTVSPPVSVSLQYTVIAIKCYKHNYIFF